MSISQNPVRWGVIGCGQIADEKPNPCLFAAGVILAVVQGQNVSEPKTYTDNTDLLADSEIYAVYIALPTGMYAEAVAVVSSLGSPSRL